MASAKLPQLLLISYTSLPPEASAKATAVAEWETNQELLEYAANDRTLDVCPVEQKGLNLVPFQAGMDTANNAIHLSRRQHTPGHHHGVLRPGDGKRWTKPLRGRFQEVSIRMRLA